MFTHLTPNQKGMILALLGYSLFSAADVMAKWIAPHYAPPQILCFEAATALVLLFLFIKPLGGWKGFDDKKELKIHAMRGVFNVGINLLLIYSFTFLPLAEIYAMVFSKPFIVTILAILIYNETVTKNRWISIIIGFIGVLIVLRPDPAHFNPGLLVPLLVTLLVAVFFISSRSLKKASNFVLAFYPMAGSFIICLPFALYYYEPIPLYHLPFFIGCGICVGLAVLTVSLAFKIAESASVAPFLYIEMIWGLLAGYLIFGDHPDFWMLAGSAIIIASGLYLILVERSKTATKANIPAALKP